MKKIRRKNHNPNWTVSLLFLWILFGSPSPGFTVSRSKGFGIRMGVWNITRQPTRIVVTDYGKDLSVGLGGIGASFYLSSRAYKNIFAEMDFHVFVSATEKHTNYIIEQVEATGLAGVSLGLRYDILSTRLPSLMKPYLSLGVGIHSVTNSIGDDELVGTDISQENEISIEIAESTVKKNSIYWGTGVNLMLSSWFALNFDFRYNLVDHNFRKAPSGMVFQFGLCFMWGKKRDIFRIQEVRQVVRDIYPSFFQFYRTYPLAYVEVRNMVSYPIEVNVKSFVRGYSESPYESGFVKIERGKTTDIPIRAFLGSQLLAASKPEPAVLNVQVEGRTGNRESKSMKTTITIHNRNAWDGDIQRLIYFVTPEDAKILQISRQVVTQVTAQSMEPNNMQIAEAFFKELQTLNVKFRQNPVVRFYEDNKVRFPTETLNEKIGDLDDLVVLYSSLLESAGIKTAFVEAQPPESDEKKLYLIFDTEVPPESAHEVSTNDKRYLILENRPGQPTVWVPIDLSELDNNYEDAWKAGAMNYLKDNIMENGLEAGWMQIVPVE